VLAFEHHTLVMIAVYIHIAKEPIELWQALLIAAGIFLFILLPSFLYVSRSAMKTHKALDDLMARAKKAKNVDELRIVRRDLVEFADKECWHRAFSSRAQTICSFIDGRLA
jgi:hypothetical protein